MRFFQGKILLLDGKPDASGEFFSSYAFKGLRYSGASIEVPLKDQTGKRIGTATVSRVKDEQHAALFVEAEISDPSVSMGVSSARIEAVGYDCDHRYENGKSVAIRVNDADILGVLVGAGNPDPRISPVDIVDIASYEESPKEDDDA